VRLAELLEPLDRLGMLSVARLPPAQRDLRVVDAVSDSRTVRPRSLFVARRGCCADGHAFVADAARAGAAAIVGSEDLAPEAAAVLHRRTIPYLRVDDSAEALGHLAAAAAGHPSQALSIVGVTGTNGKTTVTTLLHQLFSALGDRSGLIGTTGIRVGDGTFPASHTTPDAVSLQRLLRAMVRAGCRYCFVEVTSHAVDQRRIAGVDFAGGIFTNLDREHLDYHGTLDAYAAVKRRFLADLPPTAFALANVDDPRGRWMVDGIRARVAYYGRQSDALLPWSIERCDERGMDVRLGPHRTRTRLVGDHNGANLAAAVTAAILLGEDVDRVAAAIPELDGAAGRMEHVAVGPVLGIVDYAHTEAALRVALATARRLRPDGRLIVVGGCGGDRDPQKRPAMGALVATADVPIFTSDNPRSEAPEAIVEAMLTGVAAPLRGRVRVELDRRRAIRVAAELAGDGDVVLVTGKGHETTHEIAGRKHPFDDRVELAAALRGSARRRGLGAIRRRSLLRR
jgi:UDP-N-acetylmuramoyl-L-alanyl-D-glutamate--2,6-diaminopimelate ligase